MGRGCGYVSKTTDTPFCIHQERPSELSVTLQASHHVLCSPSLPPSLSPSLPPSLSLSTIQALQRLLRSNDVTTTAAANCSVTHGNEFARLLHDMVQSTVSSMRTLSHRGGCGAGLEQVKMKLESQFDDSEEVTKHSMYMGRDIYLPRHRHHLLP